MILSLYLFRQFLPPFVFGTVLFTFVLLLDKLFDIVDLIFNKGVPLLIVGKLFSLFIPTIFPLTIPMAILLACLVTFGRLSEENELLAIRAAGITLYRVLWMAPFFALVLSFSMLPFNTRVAPWANREFRTIYEKIASADPLINIEPQRFFAIKNMRLYAEKVDKKNKEMKDIFVYQITQNGNPAERIFARSGMLKTDPDLFELNLRQGQLQRYDTKEPRRLLHTTFEEYLISIPIAKEEAGKAIRYRNYSSSELRKLIDDFKQKNLPTSPLEAEASMRWAIAFAPLCLVLVGIPLATVLKKGGRSFSFGVSIIVIFIYYTLLIFGLTMAEKNRLPAMLSLWMGNITCLLLSVYFIRRLLKQ